MPCFSMVPPPGGAGLANNLWHRPHFLRSPRLGAQRHAASEFQRTVDGIVMANVHVYDSQIGLSTFGTLSELGIAKHTCFFGISMSHAIFVT